MPTTDMTTVRIEGMPNLMRKLAGLSDAVAGNALLQSVLKGSDPMLKVATAKAPSRRRGSRVRKKVDREEKESTRHSAAVAIGPTQKGGIGQFHQELGGAHFPARPWLRPSFDETVEECKREIGNQLKDRIERAARA